MADKNPAADTIQDLPASLRDGTGAAELSSPFTFKFASPLTNTLVLGSPDQAAPRPLTRTGCIRTMTRLSENKKRFRSKYGYPLRLIPYSAPGRVCTKSFNVQPVTVSEGQAVHGGAKTAAEEEEEYSEEEEEEEEEDSDYDYDDDDGGKEFNMNMAQHLLARLAAARPDVSNVFGLCSDLAHGLELDQHQLASLS